MFVAVVTFDVAVGMSVAVVMFDAVAIPAAVATPVAAAITSVGAVATGKESYIQLQKTRLKKLKELITCCKYYIILKDKPQLQNTQASDWLLVFDISPEPCKCLLIAHVQFVKPKSALSYHLETSFTRKIYSEMIQNV